MRKKIEIDRCNKCGEAKEWHCEFVPVIAEIPEKCICYKDEDWDDITEIPDVCDDYKASKDSSFEGICENCSHNIECHANKG